MFKILIAALLATALVSVALTDAQACDSLNYNNFFAMADSAERVLVVRATSSSKAKIIRVLKGKTRAALPAIKTNCDPHFEAGLKYLVFVRPGGRYYSDSSAFPLLGDQGKSWTRTAAAWIRTKDDRARSKILERALEFEFAQPALYGRWTMLNEIAKLPMPHPKIDRKQEAQLKKELAMRQALPRPSSGL